MTTNQDGPNTAGAAELKACPLCEGDAFAEEPHWRDGNLRGGEPICRKCGLKMPRHWPHRQIDAIAAWNTRPENPTPRPSVVPDEVVEIVALSVAQYLYEPGFEPLADPETRDFCENVARAAITAAIPLIRAQAVAEIVAYLRMGEHVHSRSGSIESERVFKLIADAIERGEHEND